MFRLFPAAFFWVLAGLPLTAADLPPDKSDVLPAGAVRPTVVLRTGPPPAVPVHALPEGYTLTTVAAAPMVTHPIMGCVDDRGRLFIGDAAGVNWNKRQLEANPPNRVLMLEDTDADGHYDKSTVFADKMTFPQGAAWLDGSLYVCSPPGLWKLTDTDGDGVADEREMIVRGFDYTGNAADVHGPKVHPDGRLYWCHGRKGHVVEGKDGKVVHEGKASGIWSCKPDGTDVEWHSLGCADNPTGLAFTPQGDILGTCNLYYSQPRGDTLMHWLYGGVYERKDQMQVIAGIPRTLETMPVVHNFGHVAVSGCAFADFNGNGNVDAGKNAGPLHLYVTHFNTQRLVRMDLTPEGSTYRAAENEFLKIDNPDVHLTDVIEDRDGSLLVLNTGGWFRIGCPSSLMAKPDMLGSVYRIRGPQSAPAFAISAADKDPAPDLKFQISNFTSPDLQVRRRALERLAKSGASDISDEVLVEVLADLPDPVLEHTAIHACSRVLQSEADALAFFRRAMDWHRTAAQTAAGALPPVQEGKPLPAALQALLARPEFGSRVLRVADLCGVKDAAFQSSVVRSATSEDLALFKVAMGIAARDPALSRKVIARLRDRVTVLSEPDDDASGQAALSGPAKAKVLPVVVSQIEAFIPMAMGEPAAQELLTKMLNHSQLPVRQSALRILAAQTAGVMNEGWLAPLGQQLAESPTPLLLDAVKKLKSAHFDQALQTLAADAKHPLSIRLKALDAAKNIKLTGPVFAMVEGVLSDATSSAAARIQAAGMIASAPMSKEQMVEVAPLFAVVGPVELKELLPLARKTKDAEVARVLAEELAKNPALISQQESLYRTAFSNHPPEIFETVILPARRKAEEMMDAKKRQLGPLADKAAEHGRAEEGKKHFQAGKGTCIACHKIGELGRPLGPDLSKIGAIRTERDLLESILFPSNTLARDYETHVIETRDGQSVLGVIRSHTAEGLLVMDVAGQEKSVPHDEILSNTPLTTSLMPMGLDTTLPEQELLDVVAYLRSLR